MLPIEFEKRMREMLKEEYEDFLQSYEKPRFYGLRRNSLKISQEDFLKLMPFFLKKIPWCDTGYYYEEEEQPGKHPFHEMGLYYIQEPSAMAVVSSFPLKPGERVLDLCGAPGGKSTALAAALQGEGILVCNEIHPARAKILSENIERMGVTNALVVSETPGKLGNHFAGYFDKILVDAPCSGEGMFRKNQEAVNEWSRENVMMCANRQDEILEEVVKMLRPGGQLCYSTCTFAPLENEQCTERFLEKYPDFTLLPIEKKGGMEAGNPLWTKKKNCEIGKTIRLWPHKVEGEGHYLALYERAGGEAEEGKRMPPKGLEGVKRKKEVPSLEEFMKSNIKTKIEDRLLFFGDQLYLVPEEMPVLKGLKVLRPGLHLGTVKKNRFEPSHAWALALTKDQVLRSYELTDDQIGKYLSGETIMAEGEKGWYLMTVKGYSIGWAKMAGGMLKNHYPKGLRKK